MTKVTCLGLALMMAALATAGPALAASPTAVPVKAEWGALWAFVIALGAFFVLAVAGVAGAKGNLAQPLNLPANWSFQESWASNLTVITGILTGLVGASGGITQVLGDDAKQAVALATVGAAAAVALSATATIFLLVTKRGEAVTLGGFLGAAVLTMAAATGEVWVVYRAASKLDLGGWQHRVVYAASFVIALLLLYGVRAGVDIVRGGLRPPGERGRGRTRGARTGVAPAPGAPTPAPPPTPSRRAALL